ncbi:MAG TPA: hypothetical protein VLB29_13285 [Nocardioidaceae bacterium]|nr:hypothetical protein [Nocardioidaceae bacterium]
MPDWSLVSRPHVLAAMKECDNLGSREFLRRYGFGRAVAYTLWHQGEEYDPQAILGVALVHATGTAARPDEIYDGGDRAAKFLTDLGFDVVVNEEALAAEKPRTAKPAKRKAAAARDVTPKVCPTCHMALPASGICDFCD